MTPEYAAYFVERKSFGLLSSMRAIVDPSAHLIFLTLLLTEYALYALFINENTTLSAWRFLNVTFKPPNEMTLQSFFT